MKCAKGCTACKNNANTCLVCNTDYVLNNATKKCIPTSFCHSSCSTCSADNNANKCTACSSAMTDLNYAGFGAGLTEGSCSMTATNNAQLLMTINKNAVLGTTVLKSVGYNGITESTSGTVIGTFLYSSNIITFKNLTSNTLIFNFDTLPTHQKLYVRARVFT